MTVIMHPIEIKCHSFIHYVPSFPHRSPCHSFTVCLQRLLKGMMDGVSEIPTQTSSKTLKSKHMTVFWCVLRSFSLLNHSPRASLFA